MRVYSELPDVSIRMTYNPAFSFLFTSFKVGGRQLAISVALTCSFGRAYFV